MSLRDYLFYEEPGVTLYCGDCWEVMPLLELGAIVTDPPYGIGKKYGDASRNSLKKFTETMEWLPSHGVPTAVTIPATRLYDVPKPQWIGVWHKPASFGFWNTPFFSHWDAVVFYNLGSEKRMQQDVWSVNPEKPERPDGHPTPKPIRLMTALVQAMRAAPIVDPFCGSGTVVEASKALGIDAIGIEIEPKYCEIAVKRLRQEVLSL